MIILLFLLPLFSFANNGSFLNSSEGRVTTSKLYSDLNFNKTFFCDCSFDTKGRRLNQKDCSFLLTSKRPVVRMDYIVPISIYSKNYREYTKGDPKCFSLGKKFIGSECVSLVNKKYKEMERDLHNIYPIEDNIMLKLHSLKPGIVTSGEKLNSCPIEIGDGLFMPTTYKKGWLARIYLYMDSTYPEAKILSGSEEKVLKTWDELHAPQKEECDFVTKNNNLQTKQNKTLKNRCKDIK